MLCNKAGKTLLTEALSPWAMLWPVVHCPGCLPVTTNTNNKDWIWTVGRATPLAAGVSLESATRGSSRLFQSQEKYTNLQMTYRLCQRLWPSPRVLSSWGLSPTDSSSVPALLSSHLHSLPRQTSQTPLYIL